jgi:hypothetical protein
MSDRHPLTARFPSTRLPRGGTLVLVIIIGALLGVIGIGSLRLTLFSSRMTHRTFRHHQALAVAEAGLEWAINAMNEGNVSGANWSATDTLESDAGDAIGEFIVTIEGANTTTPSFESTGYIPSVNDAVAVRRVRLRGASNLLPSYFDWAVFSYEDLKFGSDYLIDSYNSQSGAYPGAGNANSNANLGALRNGELGGQIHVHGSMQLGGRITSNSPTIHGDNDEGNANTLIQRSTPTSPPAFPDDELDAVKANNNNSAITIIDDSNRTSSFSGGTVLEADSDYTVIFPPGDYFFTMIDLGSDVDIIVQPEGKVRVFIEAPNSGDDAIKIQSYLNLNTNTANPSNFTFFVKQGKIEIQSNATVYAGLFAPSSHTIIQSDLQWYGAIVAGFVEMGSNNAVHYDESLGNPSGSGGGVLVSAWIEVTPPAI